MRNMSEGLLRVSKPHPSYSFRIGVCLKAIRLKAILKASGFFYKKPFLSLTQCSFAHCCHSPAMHRVLCAVSRGDCGMEIGLPLVGWAPPTFSTNGRPIPVPHSPRLAVQRSPRMAGLRLLPDTRVIPLTRVPASDARITPDARPYHAPPTVLGLVLVLRASFIRSPPTL